MSSSPYITDDLHAISLQAPSPASSAANLPPGPFLQHSYPNSPFSAHSDLSNGYQDNNNITLYDDLQLADFGNPISNDGDSSLLIFDPDYSTSGSMLLGQSYDYPSPSSTADSGNENSQRSRASSVSASEYASYQHQQQQQKVEYGSPHISHSFKALSFNSPNLNVGGLPSHGYPSSPPHFSSQLHKPAPSPPRLHISDGGQLNNFTPASINVNLPTINAPDGDGHLGPQLHIVPATPVGGADGNDTSGQALFHQNHHLDNIDPSLYSQDSQSGQSPYIIPQQLRNDSTFESTNNWRYNQNQYISHQNDSTLDDGSASIDISIEPPEVQQQRHQQAQAAANAYYGSPRLSMRSHPGTPSHPLQNLPQSPPSTSGPGGPLGRGGFLIPPEPIRRVKSDSAGTKGHRQSRSEDIRFDFSAAGPSSSQSIASHTSGYLDVSSTILPNIRHGRSHSIGGSRSDTLSASALSTHNFLTEMGGGDLVQRSSRSSARASPYPSPNASPRGRYDQLPPSGPIVGFPGPSSTGHHSPYLAPKDEFLEYQSPSYSGAIPITGVMGPGVSGMGGLGAGSIGAMGGVSGAATGSPASTAGGFPPPKPTVTTPRTSIASSKRRKQEATFHCPVLGCNSSFTRSFNLKGHMRSHNEEKPFECPWPGCRKGFARQHDCRRHEQLHTNFRPFHCEGCDKRFARMDALNRHLRSDGGADCLKVLEASGKLPQGFERNPPPAGRQGQRASSSGTDDDDGLGMAAYGAAG